MPQKYRRMADFHEYYTGVVVAPYLTIFIGGNHEASNHLFELYYGGWVAPNIYYLGAANVLQFGPLRISGLTGIWKPYDYTKPHFERLPYNQEEIGSIYHVRELDTRKLLSLRSQVDIGLSHDWPQGVEMHGDHHRLFRKKSFLEPDSKSGKLGSVAAKRCLDRLRPAYWFSAHLHTKFTATVHHGETEGTPHAGPSGARNITTQSTPNTKELNDQQPGFAARMAVVADGNQQRVSAWQQFHVSAKKADAEESDQILREQMQRREEEKRTGIHQTAQYDIDETFHQVHGDGALERKVISTIDQHVSNRDPSDVTEPIPNLDGSCFSRPNKRQRVMSPNAHDRLQTSSTGTTQDTEVDGSGTGMKRTPDPAQAVTNPDAIDIDMSDESDAGVEVTNKITQQAEKSSMTTNPDAIDIDMSDSSDSDADANGEAATPIANTPTITNPPSTTLAEHTQANSQGASLIMSEANEGESVELNPLAAPFNSAEMDPEAKSFAPKASTTSLTTPEVALQPAMRDPQEVKDEDTEVSEEMRAQLAALSSSFTQREEPKISAVLPFPAEIANKTTQFLALSKCEPRQDFLDLLEVCSITKPEEAITRPLKLSYDPEWLAIQRVFASELTLGGTINDRVPLHRGETYYQEQILKEQAWITEHVVDASRLEVPENFTITAPIYDPGLYVPVTEMPREVTNPQTSAFCALIGIENKFDISEEERDARIQQGPKPEGPGWLASRNRRGGGGGGHRGGRGGGGGRGGRGGRYGPRGGGSGGGSRGRGRW